MEFPASGRQIVRTSAAATRSQRTGGLVALDEVDKNASCAFGIHETDQATTGSRSTDVIDHGNTCFIESRKRPVDVGGLEGNMVQPCPARCNKLGNGALILPRRTGLRHIDVCAVSRIKILQKLQFAIAGG